MAADRQCQQQGAADLPFLLGAVDADRKRDGADRHGNPDRRKDEVRIPHHDASDVKRVHAGVVHRGDAAGDDRAADPRSVPPVRNQGNRQADRGHKDGDDQRQDGQADIVAAGKARVEGQHRDEMRRPDAEAGRDRGDHNPDRAHVAGRSARMAQQVDRRQRRQDANEGRQPDQPEVVGVGDAIIDFQHNDRTALARRYRDARTPMR